MDASKFENLGTLADEVDAAGPPTGEQVEAQAAEAQALDGAQQWGAVLQMVGAGLSMIAPELRQVYTPEACDAWGMAMQPVAAKYGWNDPTSAPEFGLALATLGVGVPTYLAISKRLEQLKREKAKPEQPAAVGDGV